MSKVPTGSPVVVDPAMRQWAVEQAIKIMRTPDDVERVAARFLHYAVHGTFPVDDGIAS